MEADRLVSERLGLLNKWLLVFRLGLYAAAIIGVLERSPTAPVPLLIAIVVAAVMPAVPGMRHNIELGVAVTIVLETVVTFLVGGFPALQVMVLFSIAVAGLFLSRRMGLLTMAVAAALQIVTIASSLSGMLPDGVSTGDMFAELVLVMATGSGFVAIGGILRTYQSRMIDQAREELRLTELVESKDRLIDTIAHEIRTPVTAVLGFSTELGSDRPFAPEEVVELARIVAGESRRLAHLVDNLVLGSRGNIDRLAFKPEMVDVSVAASSVWTDMGQEPSDLHVTGIARVMADPARLRHLFVNLFDNSLRHGALPVQLEVRRDVDQVEIVVTDQGPGIDGTTNAPFEPYTRPDGTPRPDNCGLGLSVSRTLARGMSGDLMVRDGATVLTLPAATEALAA